MGILSFLGLGNNKLKEALRNGAVIIDLRTAHEYDQGRIRESVNIPLERIRANIERIRAMKKPVILCCSSGDRISEARQILRNAGIAEIYNGGSWESLLRVLNNLRGA